MAVLVWASWSDLTKREIPNAAAVLLGLTAVADAWVGGSPLQAGWLGCISILLAGPSFGIPRADRRGGYQAFGCSSALDIRKNAGFAAHNRLGRRRACTFISLPEFGQNPQDD